MKRGDKVRIKGTTIEGEVKYVPYGDDDDMEVICFFPGLTSGPGNNMLVGALEVVTPQLTFDMLKNGDILTFVNGQKNTYLNTRSYHEQLASVVKVERIKSLETVWEKK